MFPKNKKKMIVDKVIEQAQERAVSEGQRLKQLKIGLKYVAAELSDGSVGISFRFQDDPFHIIDKNLGVVEAESIPLTELIKWTADDRSLLYSSIGLAVCNALAPWDEIQPPENADIIDALEIKDGDVVGMVGFFSPLVKRLEKRNIELRVFERSFKLPHPALYPDWAENKLLPDCDVVIVSGTSCVNGTIDQLLEYCSGARQVSVTGPTTPMYPKAFAGTNATILAGSRVRDKEGLALLSSVSLGACGSEALRFMDRFAHRL